MLQDAIISVGNLGQSIKDYQDFCQDREPATEPPRLFYFELSKFFSAKGKPAEQLRIFQDRLERRVPPGKYNLCYRVHADDPDLWSVHGLVEQILREIGAQSFTTAISIHPEGR